MAEKNGQRPDERHPAASVRDREFATQFEHDRDAYTRGKTSFVRSCVARARERATH